MEFHQSAQSARSVDTASSLLLLVRAQDGEAWRRLVRLYSPMAYRWARKAGLQEQDAHDVVQQVFLAVLSDLAGFQKQPGSSFRGWLRTICNHKICDLFRERQGKALGVGGSTANYYLQQYADHPETILFEPAETPGDPEAEQELARLRHRALQLLKEQFTEHEWTAFVRVVIHGDRVADVAEDLNLAVSSVYRARDRVLQRLRADLADR